MFRPQCIALVLLATTIARPAVLSQTKYTIPSEIRWRTDTTKGVPPGSFIAYLRGTERDTCGQLMRMRFVAGFVYPWHVNHVYAIITILQGTLVVGFDRHHAASAERKLPAGSVVQGLTTEPHYGRAIGETIFDVYLPCGIR